MMHAVTIRETVDDRIEAIKREIVFTKIAICNNWSREKNSSPLKQMPSQASFNQYPRESRDRGEVCYPNEAQSIVEWAMKNKAEFEQHSFQLRYMSLTPEVYNRLQPPRFINVVKDRIIRREKLQGYEADPHYGDFINILERGAQVQMHMDRNYPPNLIQIRYNVHVQSGDGEEGLPICCNRVVLVPERHYSRCIAGMEPHTTTDICTDRARVGISFGFLIPLSELDIFEFTPLIHSM